MAITTISDLNSLYNNIYEDSWFLTRQLSVMRPLVTLRESSGMAPRIMSQNGQITPVVIAEGGTPSTNNFARTPNGTITPVINYAGYMLTDEAMATDWQSLRQDASMEAGAALADQLDNNLIGHFSSFTAGTVGAGGAVATLTDIQVSMAMLVNNNVVGQRNAVVGAGQWLEISKALTQSGNSSFAGLFGDVGNEAMRNYFVGNFAAARWFQNSNIGTTGTAGTATGGIFTRDAIILDERTAGGPVLDFHTHEPEHGGGIRLNWRYRYGHGTRRSDHGVAFQSSNAIT